MIPKKTVEELILSHASLEKELSSGKLDKKVFADKSKEYSNLNEIIEDAKKYISFENDKLELEKILKDQGNDQELKNMAEKELEELKLQHEKSEKKLKMFLLPKDEADKKNAIIEIRAGTGGLEASSPPVPALISIIAFFLSASSFGSKNIFNFFSLFSCCSFNSSNSFSAIFLSSWSLPWSFKIFSSSSLSFSNEIYFFASSIISFKFEYSFDLSANTFLSNFPEDNSFSKEAWLKINSSTVFFGIIYFSLFQRLFFELVQQLY